MARIPVEKEHKGTPWWLWVLGLLILAAFIWLLVGLFDPDEPLEEGAVSDTLSVTEPFDTTGSMAGMTSTITDASMILAANDPALLIDREVELANMYVVSVPGDSTFIVRPENPEVQPSESAADDGTFVVRLDEIIPAPPPDVEGRYNVEPGQVVTIYGTIRELENTRLSAWGLADEDRTSLANESIYIAAERLDRVDASTTPVP